MRERRPFEVIDGSPAPETPVEHSHRVAREASDGQTLQCPACGGRALVGVQLGVRLLDGQPVGGAHQLICAVCLAGGRYVVVW